MQLSSTFSPTIQFPKIRTKLVSVITLLIGAISLFIFFYFPARLENQAIRATAAKAQSITEMTAFSVSPALYFEDRKDAEEILEGAGQSRDLAYIIVVDGSGNVFADFNRSEADQARFAQVEDDASDGDIYRTMTPILHNDVEIGKLYLGLSLKELRAEVDRSRRTTGSVSLIIFVVGMIAVFGISTIVTGPLRHMVGTVEEIAKGDLTRRATVFSDDEVGHLAKAFNQMVDNLEFAYGELEDVNRSLEKRVEERTKALQQEIVERKRTEEERRALEEQLFQSQKLESIGTLAAGIAHDFNNLLTGIIGYAQLLQRRADIPEVVRRHLGTINKQGQRAAHLIRQILDFSRKSVIQPQFLDLVPFLKETTNFLQRTIPENIRIILDIESIEHPVNADPAQIQQVVTNLAVNARDVMPDGGELRLRLSRFTLESGERPPVAEMPPGEWVVLSVSDTGMGIPPEHLPRIFDPFFTTKEVGRGTGLGLAQVYGIVAQHEGFIDVKSRMGKGTTFIIYLPILSAWEEMPEEKAPEELPVGRGETVLVVEDERVVLKMLRSLLAESGYRVLTAGNGQEALETYDRHGDEIALVLTDLVMPGMSGMELFHMLKERDPGVRVAVITGYPLEDGGEELLSRGVVAWVQKPVDFGKLTQVMREAFA